MLKFHVLSSILACGFLIVNITGQSMLGFGSWTMLWFKRCENDKEMEFKVDVRRHRLNRSHYGLDADVFLTDDVDDSYGIHGEICMWVFGGCKFFLTIAEENLPTFVKRHCEKATRRVLSSAGVESGNFRFPKGEYHIRDYILDLDELPLDGVYGEYIATMYVTGERGGERKDVACIQVSAKYSPFEEDSFLFKFFG